jgi:hypothetical protein
MMKTHPAEERSANRPADNWKLYCAASRDGRLVSAIVRHDSIRADLRSKGDDIGVQAVKLKVRVDQPHLPRLQHTREGKRLV